MLRIDNVVDQMDISGKHPFLSKLHRPKNIPRRMATFKEQFMPEKRIGSGSGCLFHAGLAHNCDYKDLVRAVDETDHWGSDLAPGKRKRNKRAVNHLNPNIKVKGIPRDVK